MPIADCRLEISVWIRSETQPRPKPIEKPNDEMPTTNRQLAIGNQKSLRFNGAGDQRLTNAIFRTRTIAGDLLIDQFDVQAERLQLPHKHVERLR